MLLSFTQRLLSTYLLQSWSSIRRTAVPNDCTAYSNAGHKKWAQRPSSDSNRTVHHSNAWVLCKSTR